MAGMVLGLRWCWNEVVLRWDGAGMGMVIAMMLGSGWCSDDAGNGLGWWQCL